MSRYSAREYDCEYNLSTRDDLEVYVKYTMTAYIPATWMEPAEGGEIEILSVEVNELGSKASIELTDEEHKALCEWISEQDHSYDDQDDY